MRDLSSLGISPWPWKMKTWQASDDYGTIVESSNNNTVCDCSWSALGDRQGEIDASLIAAAPKLYKALCDACSRRCLYCKLREADGSCNQPESDCVVQQWKSVLEEAAGEEVK